MRKHIMTGLLVLIAGYATGAIAAGSGTGGSGGSGTGGSGTSSGGRGTDNFTLNSNIGSNPNAAGRGPGSLAYSLHQVFFGGAVLTFNTDGVLVDASGKPFTGTTATGEVFKDGKKQ